MQISYLPPDMEEVIAEQCADNSELSRLVVHTSSIGENLVFQMTYFLSSITCTHIVILSMSAHFVLCKYHFLNHPQHK